MEEGSPTTGENGRVLRMSGNAEHCHFKNVPKFCFEKKWPKPNVSKTGQCAHVVPEKCNLSKQKNTSCVS